MSTQKDYALARHKLSSFLMRRAGALFEGVQKMGNMGYVRFENTMNDLMDCHEHIEDRDLSASEEDYRTCLIELCKTIAEECE